VGSRQELILSDANIYGLIFKTDTKLMDS